MEIYRKSHWLVGMLLPIFDLLIPIKIILAQLSLQFMMVIDGITMAEKTNGYERLEMIGIHGTS